MFWFYTHTLCTWIYIMKYTLFLKNSNSVYSCIVFDCIVVCNCTELYKVNFCNRLYLLLFTFYFKRVFNIWFPFVTAIGRLCEKCDGKCVICDSYVRPCTLVRICDECNYGSYQGRCVICGGPGVSDAYYCKECTIQEKDVSTFCFLYREISLYKTFVIKEFIDLRLNMKVL